MAQYKPKSKTADENFRPLPRSFYEPSADIVAAQLIGHSLIRNTPSGPCGGIIVETEAYVRGDEASHAFRGETARNRSMWGEPGHAYIYFIYGNHWCFNVVCLPPGQAEAVLIRAIEPTVGLEIMEKFRRVANPRDLTNGPGKLCAAMNIDRSLEATDLCDTAAAAFIAKNEKLKFTLSDLGPLITTTRIGITRAAELPLRFYLQGSQFVSRHVKNAK